MADTILKIAGAAGDVVCLALIVVLLIRNRKMKK